MKTSLIIGIIAQGLPLLLIVVTLLTKRTQLFK